MHDNQEGSRRNEPDALFSFNSVVVVGASEDPNRIGGTPIVLLRKYGFAGKIYALNPKYENVQGCPCFAAPEHLPHDVDAAIFAVSANMVRETLPGLQKKGLKGAVIFSAGFGESGESGVALQRWLSDFAREHGIAILGPNCVGQISFAERRSLTFANAVFSFPPMEAGRVALLSQSGGVATNIWADAVLSGTRFSHLITTGNEADLGMAEYLDYLARDDATDAAIGYIEGLKDGAAFCAAAANMQRNGKPVILMKVGTSAVGQDAMASHTGKLSSEDAGYQAAFDRYGVIRVPTLQELNDYARVFSLKDVRQNITVATTSGGAGVYVADLCTDLGIGFSRLSEETERKLAEFVPSFGRVRNPVDLTAQVVNDASILASSLKILLDDPQTGVLLFLLSGKGTKEQSEEAIRLFKAVQAETSKTLVICWLGVAETVRMRAAEAGLLVYQDPARFLRPLREYLRHRGASSAAGGTGAVPQQRGAPPRERSHAGGAVTTAKPLGSLLVKGSDGRLVLPDRASFDLLDGVGIDCPRRWFARSEGEVRRIAQTAPFPCVMKIMEPVIAHKSDVGGVVVGLRSEAELLEAWRGMAASLDAREVMIAEQVGRGVEVLVGCVQDATFGMRLTIASGGIWTNFANDAVTLIPPFDDDYVQSVLPRLGVWAPLSGARGQERLAIEKLVHAIAGIGRLAWSARSELREFECNPIIVTRDRAVAVDAIGFA
jgi:acyl-CoA synthetase (NDP forming)